MGVKYGRAYAAIISELAQALGHIEDIGAFMEMDASDWEALSVAERAACIRTAADDLFFALGTEKEYTLGSARVFHDELHHRVSVRYADGAQVDIDLIEREPLPGD
jgi:hypothetical protein